MIRTCLMTLFALFVCACTSPVDPDAKEMNYTFRVSEDYIGNNAQGWIFFSDVSGKTIYTSDLANGSRIKFHTKSTSRLTATIFLVDELPTTRTGFLKDFSFKTYVNIYPDEYLLDRPESAPESTDSNAKRINLTIKNPFPNCDVIVFGKGIKFGISSSTVSGDRKFNSVVTQDPLDVTCVVFRDPDTPPLYKKFGSIPADTPLAVSVDGASPMENKYEVTFPGADYSFYALKGIDDNGDSWNLYNGSGYVGFHPDRLAFYYTQTEFLNVVTNLLFSVGNTFYGYDLIDTTPAGNFLKIEADITSFKGSNGTIIATTNGIYDLFSASFEETIKNGNDAKRYSWSVFIPGNPGYASPLSSEINFNTPAIPEELRKKFNQLDSMKINFANPTITDYSYLPEYTECYKLELSGQPFYKVSKARYVQTKFF